MSGLRLATAPVSWGIWEQTIDRSDLVPPRPLLETVTAMGYRAMETGPSGYLAGHGAAAVEPIERTIPSSLGSGLGWAELEPDPRVPLVR